MSSKKSIGRSERDKLVRAMEYIARQVNDDGTVDLWLSLGVADGDIPYAVLTDDSENRLAEYITDEGLSELMRVFLRVMTMAYTKGGLWCDGVSSKEKGNSGYKAVKLNAEREEF